MANFISQMPQIQNLCFVLFNPSHLLMLNHLNYGLPELAMMSPCHSHANGNPEIICIDSRSESGMTNSSGNPVHYMPENYYVYILASKRNGTLYIGITNNLERRMYEHKNHLVKGFTEKYNVHACLF